MTAIWRFILAPAIAMHAIGATSLWVRTAAADPCGRERPWAGCKPGEFCIYDCANGTGKHLARTEAVENLNDRHVQNAELNDKVSAVWNRDKRAWCLYEHANTRPDLGDKQHRLLIPPHSKHVVARYRLPDGFSWNDKTSRIEPAHVEGGRPSCAKS